MTNDNTSPEERQPLGPTSADETSSPVDPEAPVESAAAKARSARPVKRRPAASSDVEAVEADGVEARGTRSRSGKARTTAVLERKPRTTPAQFVGQSAGELRKVNWPTGDQLRQYFFVVLVFVLIIIAFVGLLDLAFGWTLLKLFGAKDPQ